MYHIPAGMCQKTPIRTDREGERTRIRTGGTINTSMPQHRNAKPAPSPAEQVRLPLQWCVYFRALRTMIHEESLIIPRQFLQRSFGDVVETQLRLPARPSTRRTLYDVLPCAARRPHHLSDGLSQLVILVVEVAATEHRRRMVDKAGICERACFSITAIGADELCHFFLSCCGE